MEHNMVGWFEIPVTNMDRAKGFYEAVFKVTVQVQHFNELLMGWFPWVDGKTGASGSLVLHKEWYKPSDTHGVLIYFSSEDVSIELGRIETAGGKILQPKTLISEDVGYMGVFIDSEGNRIALHSKK
jgi:uncharacterized protein